MNGMLLKTKNEKLAMTGMLFAVGLILPFSVSHGLGMAGTVLLPMHIPVLLCGFLCGPLYAGICGFFLPIINSILTGMPALYPMVPIMSCELLTYGLVSGLLYRKTRLFKIRFGIYPALFSAMLCGRIAYGLVFYALLLRSGQCKAPTVWTAVVTGIPGMLIQILLLPPVVLFLKQGGKRNERTALYSAMNLISQNTASCVVIKENTIVRTECGRGITPVIKLYEEGVLEGALVVDKIVGKAAAMILTLGGVRACYGVTMSRAAYQWLEQHAVQTDCKTQVEAIINREGDGPCPMEQTVQELNDEETALAAVRKKLEELRNEKAERQEVL